MKISKHRFAALAATMALAAGALAAMPAAADTVVHGNSLSVDSTMLVPVSGGCGPNGWRGPWGHCRYTPYYGPLPGGYYQEMPVLPRGCPPGYWRGPWGHCRNTPYHGRLPDGGWK